MTPLQAADMLVPESQIEAITGYKQPSRQVAALREQGFERARRSMTGAVILERYHYEAVIGGYWRPAEPDEKAPVLRIPVVGGPRRKPAVVARPDRWEGVPPEVVAEIKAERKEARRALVAFHSRTRQAKKRQQVPPWADMDAIRSLYQKAAELTRATGVPHHVDHELPLQGRFVSGLHVESNLRVITASENLAKYNTYTP